MLINCGEEGRFLRRARSTSQSG